MNEQKLKSEMHFVVTRNGTEDQCQAKDLPTAIKIADKYIRKAMEAAKLKDYQTRFQDIGKIKIGGENQAVAITAITTGKSKRIFVLKIRGENGGGWNENQS